MKNLYFLLLFSLSAISVNAQSVYPGNKKAGYGGALGNGSLSISEDAGNYYFTFTKGGGDLNDAVVIYMHTKLGGFNTTAGFTDEGDGLRKAISGVQNPDRATLIFPATFKADFAIAFDKNFGGVWELVANGSHIYKNSVALTPTGTATAATYNFTLAKADVGNPPGFRFLVTYVSETGYRSNEFIGDAGPATNPQNGSYTVTSTYSFASPLPVGFSGLSAQCRNEQVAIQWLVGADCASGKFIIERAADGTHFSEIGSTQCTNSLKYQFIDAYPLNGKNYYRILNINLDGKKEYSEVIAINVANNSGLTAYNNGNVLNVKFSQARVGSYKVALVNSSGQTVLVKNFILEVPSQSISLTLDKNYRSGIYSLVIQGAEDQMSTRLFIR